MEFRYNNIPFKLEGRNIHKGQIHTCNQMLPEYNPTGNGLRGLLPKIPIYNNSNGLHRFSDPEIHFLPNEHRHRIHWNHVTEKATHTTSHVNKDKLTDLSRILMHLSNANGYLESRRMAGPRHPQLFKTTLCDYYMKGQLCKFGNKCWYAHGEHELRHSAENHPHRIFGNIAHHGSYESAHWNKFNNSSYGHSYGETRGPKHKLYNTNVVEEKVIHTSEDEFSKPSFGDVVAPRLPEAIKAPTFCRRSVASFSDSESSHDGVDGKEDEALSSVSCGLLETCEPGVCDMYAISGFCVMGENCIYEHK